MGTQNTPVLANAPASDGAAYIPQSYAPPVPEGERDTFAKALEILEAGDAGDAPPDATTPPTGDTIADAPPVTGDTPAADAPPGDADKLFQQKFDQYRREYGKLDAERKELRAVVAEHEQLKAALEEARYNPNKLLEIGKITQEEFTKLLLTQGGEMTPEMRVALEAKARAEASEKQLRTFQQSLQARQEQQLVEDYRGEARQFIADSGPEHELTRTLGVDAATDLIMQEINSHYAANLDPTTKEGPVLSYREATDRVEKRIEADILGRYINTDKVKAKIQELAGQQRAEARTPRTLTGSMTPQTQTKGPQTEAERFAAAHRQLAAVWQ